MSLNILLTGSSGGTWSGIGVSGNTFNPNGLAVGDYAITYNIGSGTCQATETHNISVSTCIPSGLRVSLRVLLQGAYNTSSGQMNSDLRNGSGNLLPLSQPYNVAPFYYAGTEIVANTTQLPTTTTDWLLVELRDPVTNNLVASKAGFLLADASVQNEYGSEGLYFTGVNAGNYRIIVRHRNHLPVASVSSVAVPTAAPYDFRVANNIMGGAAQVALLGTNISGLLAGDADANGVINVADFNVIVATNPMNNIYSAGDINLDRYYTVADFNAYKPNSSKIGVLLVRY